VRSVYSDRFALQCSPKPNDTPRLSKEMNIDKASQSMKNVKAGGDVNQQSDVPNTTQKVNEVASQGAASRKVPSRQSSIPFDRLRGVVAVVALVAVVVIYALIKYF